MECSSSAVVRSSLLSGWGNGLPSLPANARLAADGERILPVWCPPSTNERLRRVTRECALAVAVVEQALLPPTLTPETLAGPRTALVYASASAYAAANWAFLTGGREQTVYFPYTAASAVPGEVSIQFGITGPYFALLSGANAGIEALWQAALLLTTQRCDRAVVLGVETFAECEDLFAAGRWLLSPPLVETATCLILERRPALTQVRFCAGSGSDDHAMFDMLQTWPAPASVYLCLPTSKDAQHLAYLVNTRWPGTPTVVVGDMAGTCLACAPLIALQLSVATGVPGDVLFISRWWDTWSALLWPAALCDASDTRERKDA